MPTIANDKLPNSALWVKFPASVLRSEPLVVMVVPIDYDLCAGCVERIPQRFDFGIIAVFLPPN